MNPTGMNPYTFEPNVVIKAVFTVLSVFGLTGPAGGDVEAFIEMLLSWWQVLSLFSFVFSAILLFGIIYAKIRVGSVLQKLERVVEEEEHEYVRGQTNADKNERWQDVLLHINSENPNDWRLAIIEADIILEEILEQHGFVGKTIGEKLKSANSQNFRSLEDAWEAHKIRNEIAHRGGDFLLTKRTALEAITRFTKVFEEFHAI